jgi:hypothetical protein
MTPQAPANSRNWGRDSFIWQAIGHWQATGRWAGGSAG